MLSWVRLVWNVIVANDHAQRGPVPCGDKAHSAGFKCRSGIWQACRLRHTCKCRFDERGASWAVKTADFRGYTKNLWIYKGSRSQWPSEEMPTTLHSGQQAQSPAANYLICLVQDANCCMAKSVKLDLHAGMINFSLMVLKPLNIQLDATPLQYHKFYERHINSQSGARRVVWSMRNYPALTNARLVQSYYAQIYLGSSQNTNDIRSNNDGYLRNQIIRGALLNPPACSTSLLSHETIEWYLLPKMLIHVI